MPVPQGYEAHAIPGQDTFVRDEGDPQSSAHQIQGRADCVHRADDPLVRLVSAGPMTEAALHRVVEDHLGQLHHLPGLQILPILQGMSLRQRHIEAPLPELAEMEAPVPVGGVHDGHIQLLLTDLIHQLLGRMLRQQEPDPAVSLGVLPDLLKDHRIQGTGDIAHPDDHRCALPAVLEHQRGRMEFGKGRIHLLPVEVSLLGQADVPPHLFEKRHAAQLVFQVMDGAAQRRLGDPQSRSSLGVILHLGQHRKIAQNVVVHTSSPYL